MASAFAPIMRSSPVAFARLSGAFAKRLSLSYPAGFIAGQPVTTSRALLNDPNGGRADTVEFALERGGDASSGGISYPGG